MTINVATEFTRSGTFAIWESGSYNPQTDNGWACLVADSMALPQHPVFERNVAKSKHHYLFRVQPGSLVVVTNIQRMPSSKDVFSARIVVGKVTSLQTQPNEKNPAHLNAVSEIQPVWSEYFLAVKNALVETSETLKVSSPHLSGDCLEGVYLMIRASLEKALTPATEQRMFWGAIRENKPKKFRPRQESALVQDERQFRQKSDASQAQDEQQVIADSDTPQESMEASEVHDGSINPSSMSLCGLSSDPLSPLETN